MPLPPAASADYIIPRSPPPGRFFAAVFSTALAAISLTSSCAPAPHEPPPPAAVGAENEIHAAEPDADLKRFEFTRICMGVPARVLLYAADRPSAALAADAAFDRIGALDDAMSDYRPRSELMRLCKSPPGVPVAVSKDLFDVLERSIQITDASGGAFDVTMGPLVALWRASRASGVLPTPDDVDLARARVGARFLRLDPAAQTVTLARSTLQLDLGGIAKGYAAEAAVSTLREAGFPRCLVAMSGDVFAGDPPPGQTGWVVTLPAAAPIHPATPAGSASPAPVSSILLADAGASTSGDTVQFVEIDGVRYAPIVDPRPGLGSTAHLMCTVVAPRGCDADALASAVTLLGPDAARPMLDRFDHAAAIVWNADPGLPLPSAAQVHDPANRLLPSHTTPDSGSPVPAPVPPAPTSPP